MSEETYIIRVDKECTKCGYRNKTEFKDTKPIELVACGNCGEILLKPKDLSHEEEKVIGNFIDKIIKDITDVIL